jgi:NTE family protein
MLALVLGGGGARGAYQAGVLRAVARRHPSLHIPILTGISAGAVNTSFLANTAEDLLPATDRLTDLWLSLTPDQVFRVDPRSLASHAARFAMRLVSADRGRPERMQGMVDTTPLHAFLSRALAARPDGTLPGVAPNLASGRLSAVALSATSYSTAQSVTWVHRAGGPPLWQRPQRVAEDAALRVDHVMASSALPVFFPAIKVGEAWYGDGGVRQTAPLSPALHMGATRILHISARYQRSLAEADTAQIAGYPPLAQVLGVLYNAVFLDLIDQDIFRLELINRLLQELPGERRQGLRHVDILVLRPSRDLGRLAGEYEARLPSAFRFLTRGLGTRRTASPDILSLVMFQPDYVTALIELGEADADARRDEIDAFIEGAGRRPA